MWTKNDWFEFAKIARQKEENLRKEKLRKERIQKLKQLKVNE